MHTVTLSGYYGYGNAGDEAVLAGLVSALRARRSEEELRIVALSGRPAETEAAHGIKAADRYRPAALLRALARTDALLSGGGSLLQDVTSAHSVFYYLGVVRLAQRLGKKTLFVAQGVGPLLRPRTRKLVAAVANKLDAITVRDEGSAALLREIGVTRPPVEVTADPALLLQPARPVALDGDWVAVALRPWKQGGDALAERAARACREALPDARLMAVPMQPGADRPVMEHFAGIWHQAGGRPVARLDPARPETLLVPLEPLVENLAACDMVIGMRLHALILAAACAVPSVALSYDPKVAAFMAQSGQSDAVYELHSDTDAPALADLIRRAWDTRAARADALRQRLPALRAAAQRNADVALGFLP